jgi:hypothetical protein
MSELKIKLNDSENFIQLKDQLHSIFVSRFGRYGAFIKSGKLELDSPDKINATYLAKQGLGDSEILNMRLEREKEKMKEVMNFKQKEN